MLLQLWHFFTSKIKLSITEKSIQRKNMFQGGLIVFGCFLKILSIVLSMSDNKYWQESSNKKAFMGQHSLDLDIQKVIGLKVKLSHTSQDSFNKWSRFFYFEIHQATSESISCGTQKSAKMPQTMAKMIWYILTFDFVLNAIQEFVLNQTTTPIRFSFQKGLKCAYKTHGQFPRCFKLTRKKVL